jgi:hypothetical protein
VSASVVNDEEASAQKRRIRRSALLYGGIALGFYLAFIVMAVVRSLR